MAMDPTLHTKLHYDLWKWNTILCEDIQFDNFFNLKTFNSSLPSVTYMSVNWVSIGSGNGLLPVRCRDITWSNTGILSIGLLGTNFSENRIGILPFSFKKMHLKLSSAKVTAILSRGRWVKIHSKHHSSQNPNKPFGIRMRCWVWHKHSMLFSSLIYVWLKTLFLLATKQIGSQKRYIEKDGLSIW